jgi:hypothetical protein
MRTLTAILAPVIFCVGFLSSGLSIICATELTSDVFYKREQVQEIRLTISKTNLYNMKKALPERIYVPATLHWRTFRMENIAVRYKGNSSSQPHQRHKRSYLIKVNEYNKGTRFLGFRRIALDNGVQFGSLFSEPIVTDILRDLDVPVSRCNYAKLFINDDYQGVYVNVERIDESFLEFHFGSKKGPLYKVHMPGPGANFAYAGDDAQQYKKGFEAKTKIAEHSFDDLIDLIRNIDQGDKSNYEQILDKHIMLEHFLKTTAVMLFAGCFDQLTGWNPHNYYLYRSPKTDRWSYIPWDLDVGFADRAFGRMPVIDGWHAAWPIPGGPPKPILENIVTNPNLLKKYRETASFILEKYFKPDQLHSKIDKLHALIKKDLVNDPYPAKRVTNPQDGGYNDIILSMKKFMVKRYQLARQQLDNPGPRPKPHYQDPTRHHQHPKPGDLPNGPTELVVVSRTKNSIKLQWKDNAKNEAGHIVQRADKESRGMFRNFIPRPGSSETNAIDVHVIPGETYRYRVYTVFPTPNGPAGSKSSKVVVSTPPSKSRGK